MKFVNKLYEYISLYSEGNTFRVLYLMPDIENDSFEGDLLEVPTTAESTYIAISYAWEDHTVTDSIAVRGRDIGITTSLANVLRAVRSPIKPAAIWVDALCINQHDIEEKNAQIPLMSRIYARSPGVIVYLGLERDNSQVIPLFLEKMRNLQQKLDVEAYKMGRRKLSVDTYAKFGIPESEGEFWIAVRALFLRPWFERIWVVQEAVLSQRACVICGHWKLSFRELVAAVIVAVALELPLRFYPLESRNGGAQVAMFVRMYHLGATQLVKTRFRLLQLLEMCRRLSATDPHDYCYGLLALASDGQHSALKPNYFRTVADEYVKYAKYFVSAGDGVEMLYSASGQTLNLPSWVPDWSNRDIHTERLGPDSTNPEASTSIYTTATAKPADIRLHATLADVLVVRGIFFDTITTLKQNRLFPTIPTSDNTPEILENVTTLMWGGHDFNSPEGYAYLKMLTKMQSIAEHVFNLKTLLEEIWTSQPYATGEDLETVLWRTSICDLSGPRNVAHSRAPATHVQLYHAFKLHAHTFSRNWPVPDKVEFMRQGLIPELRRRSIDDMDDFQALVSAWWYGRMMARTSKGYVGQVLSRSQEGDRIFVPFGSVLPFVVRRRSNSPQTCELIGDAYVHGIMYGELSGLFETYQEEVFLC